jgi:Protein of unknown function (DUF2889)
MKMNDMVIASVDDHIIEPPNMFDQHLSAEHRKLAPRYVHDDLGNGIWDWQHEGIKTYNVGLNAVVGRPKEEYGTEPAGIHQMRKAVLETLPGTLGCTHLNDVLRSMAEVPVMTGHVN